MKFACFSEMIAPPITRPLRPHSSISFAAYVPGGLRKTEPAFGSPSGWLAMRRERFFHLAARLRAVAAGQRENRCDEPLFQRTSAGASDLDRLIAHHGPIADAVMGSSALVQFAWRSTVTTRLTMSQVSPP